jgi:WhiB family redox-sensing transcriptional regulator
MVIPTEAPDWTSAACLGVDGEIFFASEETRGSKRRQARIDRAMELCGRCPVRAECLDFALANDDPGRPYGIWGGTTGAERERLRRRHIEGAA